MAATTERRFTVLNNNPQYRTVAQAFPHIGDKLTAYWGHSNFVAYMEGLLHGTRNGTRRGFPADILMALHYLAEQHKTAFPQYEVTDDFWAYVESKPTVPNH
ncbi:hypothetical protein CKO18_00260 [Rhodoferax fermentans]|uniref:Uncharacterized protein n=1 Tax=Rhodoferax fermentans TaxID=28066 RepID=A0A1T1AV56_RHOFE|nr:hypothetical protein [Rhodoferax fermentans]OOV07989.1 hypothetical protein RF819_15810 [Rhodoferax fermentans]